MKLKRDVKTIFLVGFVTCGPLPRRTMVNLIQKRVKMFGFNFLASSSIHVFLYGGVDDHDEVDDHHTMVQMIL